MLWLFRYPWLKSSLSRPSKFIIRLIISALLSEQIDVICCSIEFDDATFYISKTKSLDLGTHFIGEKFTPVNVII